MSQASAERRASSASGSSPSSKIPSSVAMAVLPAKRAQPEQDRFRLNYIASNATSRLKRESCSTSLA
jgi:hypothetical protein